MHHHHRHQDLQVEGELWPMLYLWVIKYIYIIRCKNKSFCLLCLGGLQIEIPTGMVIQDLVEGGVDGKETSHLSSGMKFDGDLEIC